MWSNGHRDQQPQEVQSPAQALSGCVTLGETLHLSELLCAPLWKVDDTHATLCCVGTQCVESAQGYACYIYLHTGRSRTGGLGGVPRDCHIATFPRTGSRHVQLPSVTLPLWASFKGAQHSLLSIR